jgi:hypothetical protein
MEEANLVSFPKSTFDFFKEELNEIKTQGVKFTSERILNMEPIGYKDIVPNVYAGGGDYNTVVNPPFYSSENFVDNKLMAYYIYESQDMNCNEFRYLVENFLSHNHDVKKIIDDLKSKYGEYSLKKDSDLTNPTLCKVEDIRKQNPFSDMLFVTGGNGSDYFINTKDIDYIMIKDYGLWITFKNNYFTLDLKQNPHIEKLIKERLEK